MNSGRIFPPSMGWNRLLIGCAAIAALTLLGCRQVRTPDSIEESTAGQGGSQEGEPEGPPPPPADGCAELPDLEPGRITRVPERITVFSHASEPCTSLGSGFLLKNSGAAPIQITGLSVTPDTFRLGTLALPATVAPGDTIRAELGYARTSLINDSVEGQLRVMTSEGCTEFVVRGLSADDNGLTTYSELAIDFGNVEPSTKSAPRTVRVLYQNNLEGFSQPEFFGFSASPPDVFEVVRAPNSPIRLGSCESFSVDVRLIAPEAPGPVRGALEWLQQKEGPGGIAEGSVFIELFGRVE